jgi:hypothetical protein
LSTLDLSALLGAVALTVGAAAPLLRVRAGAVLALQALGVVLLGLAGVAVLFGAASLGAGFRDGLEPALGIDG